MPQSLKQHPGCEARLLDNSFSEVKRGFPRLAFREEANFLISSPDVGAGIAVVILARRVKSVEDCSGRRNSMLILQPSVYCCVDNSCHVWKERERSEYQVAKAQLRTVRASRRACSSFSSSRHRLQMKPDPSPGPENRNLSPLLPSNLSFATLALMSSSHADTARQNEHQERAVFARKMVTTTTATRAGGSDRLIV